MAYMRTQKNKLSCLMAWFASGDVLLDWFTLMCGNAKLNQFRCKQLSIA